MFHCPLQELQQLKHKGHALHAQLAEERPVPQPKLRGTPAQARPGQHELALEEQCHFQQLEERQLRAEIATLNSKVGMPAWAMDAGQCTLRQSVQSGGWCAFPMACTLSELLMCMCVPSFG